MTKGKRGKSSKTKNRRKKLKSFKKKFNIILGTIIFVLLIGSAFAIDWIFGIGFIVGFFLAVWNKIIEKNFLIPFFIFIGALIIRYGLFVALPRVLNAQDFISLGISLVLFLVILFVGWRVKTGKFRF